MRAAEFDRGDRTNRDVAGNGQVKTPMRMTSV